MPKDVAIIGLGRFGTSLAKTLQQMGANVMGIDLHEERVNGLANVLTQVVQADATDEHVVKELGLRNCDTVVVAIGSNVSASLLITVMLKDIGVKNIISKASSDLHGRALKLVGADRVVFPERDMGVRIAKYLVSPNLLEYIELSREHSIIEVTAAGFLVGKTLRQLDLRNRYDANVIAYRRGNRMNLAPRADDTIEEGDVLVLVGRNEGLDKLQSK
ncbi:MAG: TrkA family potassium uptake protein [Bacillota bacterium]